MSRFGFGKTLDFWGDVERSANNLNTSSIGEFGEGWPAVDSACAIYVRTVATG